MSLKKFIDQWKLWKYIEATLVLVIGVITLVYAIKGDYRPIGLVAGIILVAEGTLRSFVGVVTKSVIKNEFNRLFIGVFQLTLGIWLCICPNELSYNVVLIITLLILCTGAVLLADATIMAVRKAKEIKEIIMQYIVAALAIVIGIVGLVFFPFPGSDVAKKSADTVKILLIILGAILSALALTEVIVTSIIVVHSKKLEKKETIKTAEKHEEERKLQTEERKAKDAEVVEEEKEAETIAEEKTTEETKTNEENKEE